MSLGSELATIRKERGVTEKQLADHLGVKQAMISMIEAGETTWSPGLEKQIRAWITSGGGIRTAAPRGAYRTRGKSTKITSSRLK